MSAVKNLWKPEEFTHLFMIRTSNWSSEKLTSFQKCDLAVSGPSSWKWRWPRSSRGYYSRGRRRKEDVFWPRTSCLCIARRRTAGNVHATGTRLKAAAAEAACLSPRRCRAAPSLIAAAQPRTGDHVPPDSRAERKWVYSVSDFRNCIRTCPGHAGRPDTSARQSASESGFIMKRFLPSARYEAAGFVPGGHVHFQKGAPAVATLTTTTATLSWVHILKRRRRRHII
jgi:hypothetical protein